MAYDRDVEVLPIVAVDIEVVLKCTKNLASLMRSDVRHLDGTSIVSDNANNIIRTRHEEL